MGIEDEIKIEDVLQEPTKTLIAKIYMQAVITNGNVKKHEIDIACLKSDMKKKISNTVFGIGAGVIGFIILLFQVLDYLKR
jgi:hypothetical protein